MAQTAAQEAITINLRKNRMAQLAGAVMAELGKNPLFPKEYSQDVYEALAEVFYNNGAHIMTDQDRAYFGMEPRDEMGWTHSERLRAALEMEATLAAMQVKMVLPDKN